MSIIEFSQEFYEDIYNIYIKDEDNRRKIISVSRALKKFYKNLIGLSLRHFSTYIAGVYYLNDKHNLSVSLKNKLIEFNKLSRTALKNKNLILSTDEINFALKYSVEIVYFISKIEIPDTIYQIINFIPDITLKPRASDKKEKIDILGAFVVNNPFYKKRIDAIYIELECNSEDLGDFFLKVGYPFIENANMIYPSMCFNAIGAEIIRNDPLTFSIRSRGLFIFEPDYLIDATDLAESYGPKDAFKIFFLKRFFHSDVSQALVFGNLINSIFDEALLFPDCTYDEAEKKAYSNRPLSLFALHSKGMIKSSVLKRDLELYFDRIKYAVKEIIFKNYSDAIFSVESSFISPIYGIQGRLDLLAEYTDDTLRKDVVELKSGSSPSISYSINLDDKKIPVGVWVNHLAQVIAYNLLLESTFPGRRGNSSILYIKTDDNPLRDVANFPNVVEKLILHRNNIILLENALMNRSYKIFSDKNNFIIDGLPSYVFEKIDKFFLVFNSLKSYEQEYLLEMTSFILRESYTVKTGINNKLGESGFSSLWNDSIDEKLENPNIISNLTLNFLESDFDNLHLVFENLESDFFTSFRKGDIAILFSSDRESESVSINNQLIKCNIKNIDTNKVVVSLRNKLISQNLFSKDLIWRLEPDRLDTIDKMSYSSVFNLMKSKQYKRDLVFGVQAPEFNHSFKNQIQSLNGNQSDIIDKAVNCKDYFLIQGPPGTGKTNVVLKNIVKEIISNTDGNILVTAYTNRAVDEIANALSSMSQTEDFIRIGSKNASDDTEHHLPNIIDNYGMNFAYKKIKSSRIVLSTVASLLTNQEIFEIKSFDTLIVDEASQILEPQLVGLIARTNRFILIGDEKQLPPIVLQESDKRQCKSENLKEMGFNEFSESIFERLIKNCKSKGWDEAYGSLIYQARMHKDIQEFPANFFYDSQLKTAYEHQELPIFLFDNESSNPIERIMASGRIIFIDFPSENGKISSKEADFVIRIINTNSSKINIYNSTIGVISPFRMQCFEIVKRLDEKHKEQISVDTVERFQGSQRDYIIISMATGSLSLLERAVSNDSFGKVDRKLNVAITRAKSHFILLGNSEILYKSFHYSQLLSFIKEKGLYFKYSEIISN